MADEKIVIGATLQLDSAKSLESVGKIKQAFREAQKAMYAAQQEFGQFSKEAIEATKYVAELKDRMSDTKALVAAFNPDAKFKAFSAAISGVTGGFAALQGAMGLLGADSEGLQESLLKVQSAMALSQGLNQVLEAKDSFIQLGVVLKDKVVSAFKSVKAAIGETGIGLLIIALGVLVANWDKIKSAVTGVDAKMKENLETAQELEKTEQKKMEHLGAQDNILKLQGKTEREILQMKVAQITQLIKAKEATIEQQKVMLKGQIDAEERNRKILSGIIDFLTIPLNLIIKMINKGAEILGKDWKLPTVGEALASTVFNPDDVEKKGKETMEELDKQLESAKNEEAGYKLAIQKIDDDAAKKRQEKMKVAAQKEAELQKAADDLLAQMRAESREASEKVGRARDLAAIEDTYIKNREVLMKAHRSLFELNEWFRAKTLDTNRKYDEEELKTKVDAYEKQIQAEKEAQDKRVQLHEQSIQAMIQASSDLVGQETMSADMRRQALTDADARVNQDTSLSESERTALHAAFADARKKIDEQEIQHKLETANNIGSILGSVSQMVGQNTAAGKAMAVAETTISTYAAAQSAYKSQMLLATPDAPIRAAIAAAAAVASGLVRVKGILSVKVPGGSSSAPNISGAAPLSPSTPGNAVTTLDKGSIDKLGNQAIKTYVSEVDLQNNRERIERINRAARIG